jgi:hypothetical protein
MVESLGEMEIIVHIKHDIYYKYDFIHSILIEPPENVDEEDQLTGMVRMHIDSMREQLSQPKRIYDFLTNLLVP